MQLTTVNSVGDATEPADSIGVLISAAVDMSSNAAAGTRVDSISELKRLHNARGLLGGPALSAVSVVTEIDLKGRPMHAEAMKELGQMLQHLGALERLLLR